MSFSVVGTPWPSRHLGCWPSGSSFTSVLLAVTPLGTKLTESWDLWTPFLTVEMIAAAFGFIDPSNGFALASPGLDSFSAFMSCSFLIDAARSCLIFTLLGSFVDTVPEFRDGCKSAFRGCRGTQTLSPWPKAVFFILFVDMSGGTFERVLATLDSIRAFGKPFWVWMLSTFTCATGFLKGGGPWVLLIVRGLASRLMMSEDLELASDLSDSVSSSSDVLSLLIEPCSSDRQFWMSSMNFFFFKTLVTGTPLSFFFLLGLPLRTGAAREKGAMDWILQIHTWQHFSPNMKVLGICQCWRVLHIVRQNFPICKFNNHPAIRKHYSGVVLMHISAKIKHKNLAAYKVMEAMYRVRKKQDSVERCFWNASLISLFLFVGTHFICIQICVRYTYLLKS